MFAETHVFDYLATHATAEKRIFYGIAWEDYSRLLEELGDDSKLRLTFNRGVLEGRHAARRPAMAHRDARRTS